MSDIKYYRELLAQPARVEAFRRAIAAVVRPGDKVLDVGTAVGTFAFFAADAGAAAVWGVDGDPVINVARAIARLNGYDDRVEFIRGWLPDVEIPERADVIVFEDFPPQLMGGSVFRLLRSVQERYAAPGARTVPAAAELYMAPVSSPALRSEVTPLGEEDVAYGIDWSATREYVVNSPLNVGIAADALAAAAQLVAAVHFGAPPDAGAPAGEVTWQLERDTELHGLAYWFDIDLGGGERLSNAPGAEPGSWGHLFLPVDPPLQVRAGDTVLATVRTDTAADGVPRWLKWELAVGEERRKGHEFRAAPASLGDLAMASPDAVPRLAPRGELESRVLALTDGKRSIRDIAREIVAVRDGLTQSEAERLVVRALRHKIVVGHGLTSAVPRGGS